MTCAFCGGLCKKFGKDQHGLQRYCCRQCGKVLTEPHNSHFAGMYTSPAEAASVLRLMMEGMSIRSIERLTDLHRDAILRILAHAGTHCERLLQAKIHAVAVDDVQCDEIWGFKSTGSRRRLLNQREYNLLEILLTETEPNDPFSDSPSKKIKFSELRTVMSIQMAYQRVTPRTFYRELIRLGDLGFISFTRDEASKDWIIKINFEAIGKY